VKASSVVLAIGAFLFVLPLPGTFVTGFVVLLAGLLGRLFDY
jgi:chromate transport protein ChrA